MNENEPEKVGSEIQQQNDNGSTIDNFFDNFDYSLNESLSKSIELLKADDKDTKINALRNYSMSLYDVFSLDNIIENLNYVVSNSTPSYRDYFYLGLCYLDKEDYLSAIESFLKGLDINEKDYGLNYNLAISYYFNYELDTRDSIHFVKHHSSGLTKFPSACSVFCPQRGAAVGREA